MTGTEIIEALRDKLSMPGGRHLYGVLGTYPALDAFARTLQQARTPDGKSFSEPVSVNKGILDAIPDEEFRSLAENEARKPEPTAAHVGRAFARFLRQVLQEKGLVVLSGVELLFAYNLELNLLRTMAADEYRVILLLPGRREGGRVVMFPVASAEGRATHSYTLPTNLIAENHLWEVTG